MDLQYLIVIAIILGAIIFTTKTLVQNAVRFPQNLVVATIAVAISKCRTGVGRRRVKRHSVFRLLLH